MAEKRGKLIVIEGTDCSGKATQAKLLIDRLKAENIPCETMGFPRYDTPTGRIIGECYLGKTGESWFGKADSVDPRTASLYYAADRHNVSPEIRKILDSGAHLILDRYVESNMGHQGGKAGTSEKRIEIIKFIENLEYGLLQLPKPNKVIFLYMPYQVGMELKKDRKGKADGHESNPEHLRNAEQAYLQLAEMYDWLRIDCTPDGTINSLRTPENISQEVWNKMKEILSI